MTDASSRGRLLTSTPVLPSAYLEPASGASFVSLARLYFRRGWPRDGGIVVPYKLNQQQFAAVLRLPGDERYRHFIARVADWEEIWALKSEDGFVSLADDEGHACLPVWPHPDYAVALATEDWSGSSPSLIKLAHFLEKWVEGMSRDGVHVAVFPNRAGRGVVVAPDRLKSDLETELEKSE